MLGPNFREGSEKRITLQGVDGPTLKAVICYIYAGQIELTEDNVANILAASSGMEIVSLERKCGQYLKEVVLRKDNCLDVLMLADTYNVQSLKPQALQLVCENFEILPRADILKIDGNIFTDILRSNVIKLMETDLFDCLVEWLQQNETERAKFVPSLLKLVKLEYMPGEVTHLIRLISDFGDISTLVKSYFVSVLVFKSRIILHAFWTQSACI